MTLIIGPNSIKLLNPNGTIKDITPEPSAADLRTAVERDIDLWRN